MLLIIHGKQKHWQKRIWFNKNENFPQHYSKTFDNDSSYMVQKCTVGLSQECSGESKHGLVRTRTDKSHSDSSLENL